jgi:uncharacterized membrane protein
MRWFFVTLYGVAGVLFLAFAGWVITRMMHLDAANYWMGRVIVWDLYAVGVVVSYVAFVGGWHLWEKLTGRMEPGREEAD